MKFLPFGRQLAGVPHVLVDSGRTADTVLELSHWPGNRTPVRFKADTSTEIALNFLRSPECAGFLSRTDAVSCDHYDIDGLLASWAIVHSSEALDDDALISEIAATDDFGVFISDRSFRAYLDLLRHEESVLQPRIPAQLDTEAVTGFLFTEMLPSVCSYLRGAGKLEPLWLDEYRHMYASLSEIDSGRAHVTAFPELDLTVVESDAPLHDCAIHARVDTFRVLTICNNQSTYVFRYRYESFVDLITRKPAPRIRPDSFVSRLCEWERNPGRWLMESVATAHPRLQFYSAAGMPAPSSIPKERFVDELINHLREGSQRPDLQWRSGVDWADEPGVPLPPSVSAG